MSYLLLVTILTGVFLYTLYRNYYWIKRILELWSAFVIPLVSVINQNGLVDKILKFFEYYHPIGTLYIGHAMHTIISNPETVELLLKNHVAKGPVYEYIKPYVGNALLTAPADVWKVHRKLINQTFNQNILNTYMDSFVKCSKNLVENLQSYQNTEVDIYLKFVKSYSEIICETIMGTDVSETDELDKYIDFIFRTKQISTNRLLNPLFYFELFWKIFGKAKEEQELISLGMEYTNKIVTNFKKEKNNFETKHFLRFLIEQRSWSNKEILHEVVDMAIGGTDSTSLTSSFVMLMLAIHQDIQEKVYQELYQIFGTSNREVSLEDLGKMDYLDQVIKETLRLFPIGPIIFRKLDKEFKWGDYTIANGHNVIIPIIFMHRNPVYWPDPLKYDPDRFLPEEVAKRPRYAFMPFSVPPRNCIGMKFADMAMKVMLSTVLRHFKVFTKQYASVASIHLNIQLFLTAADGFDVTLVPRIE